MLRRLRQNTLILTVSNVGSAGLSFLLVALIGRATGEDGLGIYATALAWVFPISIIAEFGIGTLITRDIAQNPAQTNAYLHITVMQRLSMGGVLCVMMVGIAPLLNDNSLVIRGIVISAPLIIVNPFYGAFTALFRAYQVMLPIAMLNLSMLVAQVIFTLLVLNANGDIIDVLAINTLTSTGQLFFAWAWWRFSPPSALKSHNAPSKKINTRQTMSHILRRAYPFAIAGILAAFNTRIGVILLEQFADTAEVGYYAAVTRLTEGLRMVPNAVFGAVFPMLAGLTANPARLRQLFRQIQGGLFAYGVLVALIFTLLSSAILTIVFGERFATATPILQIALWGLIPALIRAGQTLYWYAYEHETVVNWVTLGAITLQTLLSLWLIPQHGAVGLAWVILLTECTMMIALWLLQRRMLP